jgi:hypothetical protein
MVKILKYSVLIFLLFQISCANQEEAIEKINKCKNIYELKTLYNSNFFEDFKSEDEEDNIVLEIRKKIQSFDLEEEKLCEVDKWFNPRVKDYNIVILPDLSRRLIDYKDQAKTDLKIINNITQKFNLLLKHKRGSSDRIIVDVVGNNQGGGKEIFDNIAENLSIDISKDSKKFGVEIYNDRIPIFEKSLIELYQNSKSKPQGADFWYYFNSPNVENNLKKSNAYTKFENIMVILTDGYLEPENNVLAYMNSKNLKNSKIPLINKNYKDWRIVVCEITERNQGNDFYFIDKLWTDWFKEMNIECVKIIPNNPNINSTNNIINAFIDKECIKKKVKII